MFHKVRVIRKVILLAVFEYEYSIVFQHICLEYPFRYGMKFGQSVWRISKDEVELLFASLYEAENVAAYRNAVVDAEFSHALFYKGMMVAVCLHAYYLLATSRYEFERNAASTGKHVESRAALKVDVSVEHIKDVLLGEIGSRPCLERSWHFKAPAFVYSSYYSHNLSSTIKL